MQTHEYGQLQEKIWNEEILMTNAIVIEVDRLEKYATSYGTFRSEGMIVSNRDDTKKVLVDAIKDAAKQMDKVIGEIVDVNIPDVAGIEVKKADGEMTTVYSYKANVTAELK